MSKANKILTLNSFLLLLIFIISSCSNTTSCDCVDEFDKFNFTSEKYNNCLDIAINDGGGVDPYNYHKKKCND